MDVNSRDPLQNIIPFRIKGVEIGRFDSSGNLKIGTTTTLAPTVRLDISGGEARVNSGSAASTALTTTGRIGVNVASPTVSLDVSGAVNITASSAVASALTTRGRIGINTAAPASDLDVNGAVVMRSTLLLNNSLTLPTGFWHKSNDNVERLQYITSGNTVFKSGNGFLWYDSNNAVRMFLSNSGLLGIGHSSPTYALHIEGGAAYINSNASTSTALVTTGRIGVNTTSPTVSLDVSGAARVSASSATATALTTTGRIGVNTASPTVDLDVTGAANVSTYLSVGSGGSSSVTTTSNIPDAFYVRTGGSNWRDFIPLLVANSTTNRQGWGLDPQWYDVSNAQENEIAKQFSYFAGYWLNANRAVIGTSFTVYSQDSTGSVSSNFTFTATAMLNGVITAYTGFLSQGGFGTRQLTPQQDGIDAGVARRLLSNPNRTLLMGGSVETGYLRVSGTARVSASTATATALTTTGRIGVNTATPTVDLDVAGEGNILTGLTIGSTSDANVITNTYDSKLAIYHNTSPKIYMSTSSSAVGGLLIGKDAVRAYIDNRESGGELAIVTEQNIPIVFKTNANNVLGGWGINRMVITGAGRIGIGTDVPLYPVDIVGTVTTSRDATSYWWGQGSPGDSINTDNVNGTPISMRLNGSVWIESTTTRVGFWATSDCRIKKNINYNISSECLNLFRQLKCSNYSYIDERANKTNVYGYIAQDVSTVIPYAVTTQKGFIPSLYSLAKISKENGIIKLTCSEQKTYTFYSLHDNQGKAFTDDNNEPASDKDGGRHFKVKLYDISMNEYIVRINEILDNGIFTIENDDVSIKLTHDEYFVFGQEVDDYKILNNESIAMVATAALQEVDRQQQADKARIAELEATVASQQSLINDILERLNKNGL